MQRYPGYQGGFGIRQNYTGQIRRRQEVTHDLTVSQPPALVRQQWHPSPYEAAFGGNRDLHNRQFSDRYADAYIDEFAAEQSQYLLGANEQLPRSSVRIRDVTDEPEEAFVPGYDDDDLSYLGAAAPPAPPTAPRAAPGRQIPLNHRGRVPQARRGTVQSVSQAAIDFAVQKALEEQKLQFDERLRKEAEEKEMLQYQYEMSKHQQQAQKLLVRPPTARGFRPATATISQPSLPAQTSSKRQLPDFEVSESQGLRVVLKKKKMQQDVIYLDDNGENNAQEGTPEDVESNTRSFDDNPSFDSGVVVDDTEEKYITLKVPKDRVTSSKLDVIKKEFQTDADATSLTDEQVLASSPHLLSAPDKRRREKLLQSSRQKRHIAKKVEQQGAEAVRANIRERVQRHRRTKSKSMEQDDDDDEEEDDSSEDEVPETPTPVIKKTPAPRRGRSETPATKSSQKRKQASVTPETPSTSKKRNPKCTDLLLSKTERDKLRKRRQRENLSPYYVNKTKKYDSGRAAQKRKESKTIKSSNAIRKQRSRSLGSLSIKTGKDYSYLAQKMVMAAANSPEKFEQLVYCMKRKFPVNIATSVTSESPATTPKADNNPVCLLKSFKDKNRLVEHACLVSQVKEQYGSLGKAADKFGLSRRTFERICARKTEKKTTRRQLEFQARKSSVAEFFNLENVSKVLPIARHAKKRFMTTTYDESYTQYTEWCEKRGIKPVAPTTYSRLKPENIFSVADIPIQECCCKQCLNMRYLKNAMISNQIQGLPSKTSDAISLTLCDNVTNVSYTNGKFGKYSCIVRNCETCGVHQLRKIIMDNNPALENSEKKVQWKRWETPSEHAGIPKGTRSSDGKKKKAERCDIFWNSGTKMDLVQVFLNDLSELPEHVFKWKWHDTQYQYIKEHLTGSMLIQILDFSQNFLNKFQDEISSMHWNHSQTVLHPIVNYYRCPVDGELITEEHVMVTDDLDHDKFAVEEFMRICLQELQQNGFTPSALLQLCDNCLRQYKSKFIFEFLSKYLIPVIRSYFGESHGKSASDSCTGRVKQMVRNAIKNREVIVKNALDFHKFLEKKFKELNDKRLKSGKCVHFIQKSFYISNIDRSEKMEAVTIAGTKEFHSVRTTGHPYVIEARTVACLCESCLNSDSKACPNKDYASSWTQYNVKTGKVVKQKDLLTNLHWPINQVTDAVTDGTKKSTVLRAAPINNSQNTKKKQQENNIDKSKNKMRKQGGKENTEPKKSAPKKRNLPRKTNQVEETPMQALHKEMRACAHYAALKQLLQFEHFQIMPNFTGTIQCMQRGFDIDVVAQPLIPHEWRDFRAVTTEPDGNCWARAVSRALFGCEELYFKELRMQIVMEGVINEERYFDEEYLHLGCEKNYLKPIPVVFAGYSGEEPNFGRGKKNETEVEKNERLLKYAREIYKREMHSFRTDSTYAGLWQQMQTTNCIKRPIRCVFPLLAPDVFRLDFHRMMYPYEQKYRKREPITIMWTPLKAGAAVNHFVALLRSSQC